MNIDAILWDFDGTIVDTVSKHFTINKKIFSLLKPNLQKDKLPLALSSLESYQNAEKLAKNWRELYMLHLGFSENQTDRAGNLWSEFQLKEDSFTKIFEGISKVLHSLSSIPHGICSQNCSTEIKRVLKANELDQYFKSIIGHKDISFNKQKPDPEGFISCLNKMNIKNFQTIYYIGDHEQDVRFAKNAEVFLQKQGFDCRILAIAVCYNGSDTHGWEIQPDHKAYFANDIISIMS